jgi:hypothetical protein
VYPEVSVISMPSSGDAGEEAQALKTRRALTNKKKGDQCSFFLIVFVL